MRHMHNWDSYARRGIRLNVICDIAKEYSKFIHISFISVFMKFLDVFNYLIPRITVEINMSVGPNCAYAMFAESFSILKKWTCFRGYEQFLIFMESKFMLIRGEIVARLRAVSSIESDTWPINDECVNGIPRGRILYRRKEEKEEWEKAASISVYVYIFRFGFVLLADTFRVWGHPHHSVMFMGPILVPRHFFRSLRWYLPAIWLAKSRFSRW